MRIVCVARVVPDPRAAIKVLGDGAGIDRAGLKYVCDPFDEFGLEFAVQLKEKRTDVAPVMVVAAGAAGAVDALRHALSMGCERAVHLVDETLATWDELGVARALAAAIRHAEPSADLIICGKQGIDNDAGETGPAVAEHLGLPHVGAATRVEIDADGRTARVHRRTEGGEEVVDMTLPGVITIEKGMVEPRRPALARLMKAKSHPVEVLIPGTIGLTSTAPTAKFLGVSAPAARAACVMISGEPAAMASELTRRLREEARVI